MLVNNIRYIHILVSYILHSYKGRSESTDRNQIISIENHYLIFIFVMRLDPVPASLDTPEPALEQLVETVTEEVSWSIIEYLS